MKVVAGIMVALSLSVCAGCVTVRVTPAAAPPASHSPALTPTQEALAAARARAQDKQAQSNIRNGLTTELTYYVDNQAFTVKPANLNAIEPSLDFTQADASTRGVLPALVKAGDDRAGGVCLESDSESGSKFFLVDIALGTQSGTWYGKNATCPANDSAAPVGFSHDLATGWK